MRSSAPPPQKQRRLTAPPPGILRPVMTTRAWFPPPIAPWHGSYLPHPAGFIPQQPVPHPSSLFFAPPTPAQHYHPPFPPPWAHQSGHAIMAPPPRLVDLFDFTPFGMYCRVCNNHVCDIEHSFKKHAESVHRSKVSPEEANAFGGFARAEVTRLCKEGDLEKYISEKLDGWLCGCGKSFVAKFNLNRHCRESKIGCDPNTANPTILHKTICGRFIANSTLQTMSDLADPDPKIAKRRTFSRTRSFLESIVPQNEDIQTYVPLFNNWVATVDEGNDLAMELHSLVDLVDRQVEDDEIVVKKAIGCVDEWLENIKSTVDSVPANLRTSLQNWTASAHMVGDFAKDETFTIRHFEGSLKKPLVKMLTFVLRHESGLLDDIKSSIKLLAGSPICPSFITDILVELILENPRNLQNHPLAMLMCLACCCRNKGDSTLLRACGSTGTLVAAFLHLWKCAICDKMYFREDQHGNQELVDRAVKSVTFNQTGPLIKRHRVAHTKKPKQQQATTATNGDIYVGDFSFSRLKWSQLIPQALKRFRSIFARIIDGPDWMQFLEPSACLVVTRLEFGEFDASICIQGKVYKMSELRVKSMPDIKDELTLLGSLSMLAFHSFGCGAARQLEVERLDLSKIVWHHDSLYYSTETIKTGSRNGINQAKMTDHKLPPRVAICYLIFRITCCDRSNSLIPESFKHCSVGQAAQDLFQLDKTPTAWNVRQLMCSIANVVIPGNDNPLVNLCTDEAAAKQFGHSHQTHKAHYNSAIVEGTELMYSFHHRALGYNECNELSRHSLSENDLYKALKHRFGANAEYRSSAQERMIWLAASLSQKHAHVSLPCGSGKSLAWELPLLAAALSGKVAPTFFVVVPYRFLNNFLLDSAQKCLGDYDEAISICTLSTEECQGHFLPEALSKIDYLPNLVVLTIDALDALVHNHSGAIKEWARRGKIHRFFIDEIHLIFSETFRGSYDILPRLSQFKVPIMTLSGTVPGSLVLSLSRYLHLTDRNHLDEIDVDLVVPKETLLGTYPEGFQVCVSRTSDIMRATIEAVKYRMSLPGDKSSVHVICSTKRLVDSIQQQLVAFRCEAVTSDVDRQTQSRVAKEWAGGSIEVLITTSCGLVGNESSMCSCIIICGYPYDLMSLVQAMGRLRPKQRTSTGLIRIILPEEHPSVDAVQKEADSQEHLVAKHLLSDASAKASFSEVGTLKGVYNWVCNKQNCRIESLSAVFGVHCGPCGVCDICTDSPISRVAAASTAEQAEQERTAQRACHCLNNLLEQCPFCKDPRCIGELCLGPNCWRCGDSRHQTRTCTVDYPKILQNIGDRFCPYCLDCKRRPGYTVHNHLTCPHKKRIKRLFICSFKYRGPPQFRAQNFVTHIKKNFASADTFNNFIVKACEEITNSG